MLSRTSRALVIVLTGIIAAPFVAAEDRRRIEEVVVTAERKEASVSDTSISITALTDEFMEDFGIRNQSDLQNLIPSTVIRPYDLSIRGIGRPFRALGGDPGVATYVDGVYSEDFYIASSGGFWDIERVEVLRGPQGTLYGRNAVGGAVNFLHKKPTDEFEAEFKGVLSNFSGKDVYGMVSGTLIENMLTARVTGYNRDRDGIIEEKGIGPDLDSLNDENYTLQLRFNPTDTIEMNMRVNERSVNRVMGGADGGGLVILSEEGMGQRNTISPSFGYRAIDRTQGDYNQADFFDTTQPTFNFTNPTTGEVVEAQRLRGGFDPAIGTGTGRQNQSFGVEDPHNECVFFDRDDIDGDDLCATTNGLNFERFDHQAVTFDAEWQASDSMSFKYIFGYTDYFYDRITDDDLSASQTFDRQFYVIQETEYVSHELQWFWDVSDRLSFTTGAFAYNAKITQRGDFYSSVGEARYTTPSVGGPLGTVLSGIVGAPFEPGQVRLASAREANTFIRIGDWEGDPASAESRIPHGPRTAGTDLDYQTRSIRDAYAAYSQGVFDITDTLSVTFGVRWAEDNLDSYETLSRYSENILPQDGATLLGINIATGAILGDTVAGTPTLDANGQLQYDTSVPLLTEGLPVSLSVFREFERTDSKVTWRLNFDWTPTDDSLVYAGVTTGYRAGGNNLAFFSATGEYDPEELTAYEIGYKGSFFDGTMQLNASTYLYDYENVHSVVYEASATGGTTNSVVAIEGAEIWGIEGDILWFPSEALTLGGNASYTPSKFTADFNVIDNFNPNSPEGLFSPEDRTINGKGASLPRVTELKWTVWGQYQFNLGDNGAIDLKSSYAWIDSVNFTVFDAKRDEAPSYGRWDARATWQSTTGKYVVSAFVNNILDEIGIRQVLPETEETGWRRSAMTTEPRIFGLEFSIKMGPEY